MSLRTMIGAWSRDEKLEALDLLWQDLTVDTQKFDSPEWHARVLADRLKTPAAGSALPLAEAKAEILEAIDARRTAG